MGASEALPPSGLGGSAPLSPPSPPRGEGGWGGEGAFLYIMENSFEIYKKIEKTLDKPFEL